MTARRRDAKNRQRMPRPRSAVFSSRKRQKGAELEELLTLLAEAGEEIREAFASIGEELRALDAEVKAAKEAGADGN